MLPPGLKRTTGGGSKPGQSSCSMRELQEDLKKVLARKRAEEHAASAAKAAKAARKSGQKAPKGGVKKPHRY